MLEADIDRSLLGHFLVKNGQCHFKLNTASLRKLSVVVPCSEFQAELFGHL